MARKGLKVATATINGKREYFYARTKREAILRAEAAKLKKAGCRPSNKMLYADWLKTYLAIARDRVTAATLESYRTLINKHIVPCFGYLPLMDLDHIEIREYLSQMLTQGLSPRTVNYVHTLFKATLKQAVEDGLLAQNPMDKVHKVKQPRSTARAILTKVIQSRLGHASITTTLNTYAHLTADDEEQAAGAMETVFSLLHSQ